MGRFQNAIDWDGDRFIVSRLRRRVKIAFVTKKMTRQRCPRRFELAKWTVHCLAACE
jgi:hypothetical protein